MFWIFFDGALKKVVERMEGPLIDEFRWMLRDIRMGMTRGEVYEVYG